MFSSSRVSRLTRQRWHYRSWFPACVFLCRADGPSLLHPQVMQVLVWVVSTVLLKFMLSTVLSASDDVREAELKW